MPYLALPAPELTRAQAHLLFSIPMEGLCPCPALAIGLENAMDFPIGTVGDQHLAWFGIALLLPELHDSYHVSDAWNTNALGEVPLLFASDGGLAATQWL